MRVCENQKIGLQPRNFFQIHVRPILCGIHDGFSARVAQSVREKRVPAGRDERLSPNHKKNALRGQCANAALEIGEAMLHLVGHRRAGIRNAQQLGKFFCEMDDVIHGVWIGGVGRNSQLIERMHRFREVESFRHENQIRMECGNHLQAGIGSTAHLGFFPGIGRVITIIGVTDQTILQAKRVNRFR
jgi:hypothetical protein